MGSPTPHSTPGAAQRGAFLARACLLLLAGLLLLPAARAQAWRVETLALQTGSGPREMAVAMSAPADAAVRHVVIYPQPGGERQLKVREGSVALSLVSPWTRAASELLRHGIAVLYADPPDGPAQGLAQRPAADTRALLQAAVAHARQRFPAAAVHLAAWSNGAPPVLDAAADLDPVQRVVLVSPALANARASAWRLRQPVLVFHAPGTQCDAAPFHESRWIAGRQGWTLVEAYYAAPETEPACGRGSQHVLEALYPPFADAVRRWLDGEPAPAAIGASSSALAWTEEVATYAAPRILGEDRLEITLLVPQRPGPVPVVLFNHGDIDMDHPAIRHKARMRLMPLAREFLKLGLAVAMPQRRGVGLSTGRYPDGFRAVDGDPVYKARVHAEDILPALEWLRTRPQLDGRIVLAGHSAGGYSALYVAATRPAGVVGVVNFSGGRTDMTATAAASALNPTMVAGYRELGAAVRVPVLLLFTANDSRYSAPTIRASHEAFHAAGGDARLLLLGPIAGDGHQLIGHADLWRAAVADFLQQLGVVAR